MRTLAWLVLLSLAAPLAGAQSEAQPSLTLDPDAARAAPRGEVGTIAVLQNPTSQPIAYHMSYGSDENASVTFGRTNVTVPAGGEARVPIKVILPNATSGRHPIRIYAAEWNGTSVVTRADVRLIAIFTVEIIPRGTPTNLTPLDPSTATAQAPTGTFALPADLTVTAGNTTAGMLVFQNTGNEPVSPTFHARPVGGLTFQFAAVSVVRPGETVRVPFGVTAATDAGPNILLAEVSASGVAAPSQTLRIDIQRAGPTPLSQALTAESAGGSDTRALVAAGALVGVAGLWASLWSTRRHWWPFLAALYTRLRPSKLLDHPVRAKIVEVVKAQPGITFSDLAREVGIAPGQLTHHARMLEKGGIVFSSPDGQTRRFFHVEHGRLQPVASLAERALALVQVRPRKASDLARELGVTRQALHYHLKHLIAEGRLAARAEGRDIWLEAATPQGSSAAAGVARS